MNLKIAILAGDGIGPEIMKQGVAVLDAVAEKCGHKFEYEEAICGAGGSGGRLRHRCRRRPLS